MVSPISARLLNGTRNDSPLSERLVAANRAASDASSQSSNGSRTSSSNLNNNNKTTLKKRTASGALKHSEKLESSVSGYSGDKEDTSVVPPVYSIDFHGRDKKTPPPISGRTSAVNCPKRQKMNQMNFAATCAKDDLERAGLEFKNFDRDNEEAKAPGSTDVTIKLKGVRLVHSKEVTAPLISSNVSSKCTVEEYEALSQAVSDSYQSSTGLQSFEPPPSTQGNRSSDSQSTSSVSDTESDSGSDNANNNNNSANQIFLIPPLVEDSIDPAKEKKIKKLPLQSTCNVISCASNATTLTESLQLSTDPRVVTLSTTPYSIIHANAAFLRLSGKGDAGKVLGSSFTTFLDPDANAAGNSINLTSCMVSSSMGNDSKLFLLPKTLRNDPVECAIRVSPIVARKTQSKEVTTISHFSIELFESINGVTVATSPTHSSDVPVGVMG